MKTVLTASAVALVALTGAASAVTPGAAAGEIRQYLPAFDLSSYDAAALSEAADFIRQSNGSSEDASFAEIQNGVRFILETSN